MVRRFGALLGLCVLLLGLVGCAAIGPASPTTQPATVEEVKAAVAQNEATLTEASQIATSVVLLSVSDKDRAQFGLFAYQTASKVYAAASQDKVDLATVRALAQELISKSDLKHKAEVGLLLDNLTSLIDARLHVGYLSLVPDDVKLLAAKSYLRGVAKGVMTATQSFGAVGWVPDTPAELARKINMRWYRPTVLYRIC